MMNWKMHLARPYVVIVLLGDLALLCNETDGQKACSCYTFEKSATQRGIETWPVAKSSCEDQNKHLVTMETEREWEFIRNLTQTRTGLRENEWLIGLFRIPKNACWAWVSGQPLTINKWQDKEPNFGDLFGLIAKNYPHDTYGLFAGIPTNIPREWICEEETDNCTGTCFYHNFVQTTATSTRRTTIATTERTSSAAEDLTDLSESIATSSGSETAPESTSSGGEPTAGKNDEDTAGDKCDRTTVMVLSVSLAAVSSIAIIACALAVFFLLKQKKRRTQDAERPSETSLNPLEDQNEPILNPENAATQLGLTETEDGVGSNKRESRQSGTPPNREYTMLNPLTMTQGDKFYISLVEGEQGIGASGAGDESPNYVNQLPLPEYMNAPV